MITICYVTNRKISRIHWFFDSLARQWWDSGHHPVKLVVVDFYADAWGRKESLLLATKTMRENGVWFDHTAPMPNVWQGPHRLTQRDYFAASNSRNTGLCYADDGYIVYVDDLSVLLPGWFAQVQQAAKEGYVACGAYAKVRNLEVQDGFVNSFNGIGNPDLNQVESICRSAWPTGFDSRWRFAHESMEPFPCGGSWLFGASCAMPVEALLQIGGWDTRCDSMGAEDYTCGIMLEKHGYPIRYCKRMMTLESEEAHAEEAPFLRIIKGPPGKDDQSWRHLNLITNDPKPVCPDIWGNGGIRGLRQRVLAGEPFPIVQIPQHHPYDGQPLSEM